MKREVLVVDFGTIKLSKLDTLPLEMGRLEMNVPVRVKLSVENDTVKDISVVGIEVSCGCTKAMPSVSTAKPGELIPFTFDLSPDKRPNRFTHTIKINFVDLAVGVKLSGQYSLPFEFSPSVLLFKNEGGQFTANFTLRTYDKYRLAPISKSLKISDGFTLELKQADEFTVHGQVTSQLSVNEALHRVREVLEFRGVFENMVGAERNFSHHVDATYEGALTISPPIISIRSSGDILFRKSHVKNGIQHADHD